MDPHAGTVLRSKGQEERIQSLDVLRGFALLGILVVNMRVLAGPSLYWGGANLPGPTDPLDQAADTLVAIVAAGKFFPLFSFLFGVGLAIQLLSWQAKGAPAARLFARRLTFLLLLGLGHATFIWAGDILAKYAVLGMLFLLVIRLAPTYLVLLAGMLLLMPFLLGWLDADARLSTLMGLPSTPPEYRGQVDASLAAYGQGTFWEMTRQRLVDYRYRLGAWTYVSGMFTILAMFCLGALAGRTGFFRAQDGSRIKAIGLAAFAVLSFATLVARFSGGALPILPPQLNKLAILAQNLSTTTIYVCGILLLLEAPVWQARLAPLGSAGRMALTNYLLQSVLATSLLYGTGLYGTLGAAAGLGIAISIFAIQLAASSLWLRRFRFGPVEWLWRWFTYGERPPLRRAPSELRDAVG